MIKAILFAIESYRKETILNDFNKNKLIEKLNRCIRLIK